MRGGWPEEAIRWENEVASVRSRSARVMMTLMRNGRDRRSENRDGSREQRARAFDWDRSADHIRASSQTAAFKGRIHGCTRTFREKVRFFSLASRAPSIHGTKGKCRLAPLTTVVERAPDSTRPQLLGHPCPMAAAHLVATYSLRDQTYSLSSGVISRSFLFTFQLP